MFEKEIEYIYKYNLNKIEHLGSFITYEQLLSTNIHPALLQYLSAEIDFLIYEDRQKLLKESLFDYSGDKIIEHFANIGEEIKRTKKFSYEYLSKLLLHASSFNTNFIIRPKWSLLQFIFENEDETEKQVVEIKQILNYLYYYPYLKRLLISFFNKKRLITITKSELKELLDKIDTINVESNFDKVLESTLTTMAEFIYIGEIQNKKVSRQFIELFLADKGLNHLTVGLSEKFGANSNEKIDIADLKNTILGYFSENANYSDKDIDRLSEIESNDNPQIEDEEFVNEEIEQTEKVPKEDFEEDETNHSIDEESEDILSVSESKITTADNNEDFEETDSQKEKKSFLESYIEKAENEEPKEEEDDKDSNSNESDEKIETDIEEEITPADLDEETRVDEEDVEELFELATEEEKIDSFLEDSDNYIDRIEINDEDGNPFEDSELNTESKVLPNDTEEEEDELEEGFVPQGASVTFKADELLNQKDEIKEDSEEQIDEANDWPTEFSNNTDANVILEEEFEEEQLEENEGDISAEDTISKTESSDSNADELDDEDSHVDNIEGAAENENQQMLFTDDDFSESEEVDENRESEKEDLNRNEESTSSEHIDISLLLENKKITKIIEVIFDYDMEEFANAIDLISVCNSVEDAHNVIDEIAEKAYIDSATKEIKIFKNIISNYFKQ